MTETQRYQTSKKHVRELKDFWIHLAAFVVANAGMIALNLVQQPDKLWFHWVLMGWGVGILVHGFKVFGGGIADILIGIAAFSLNVLFRLVNLPVGFDASRRARLMLVKHGIVTEHEVVLVNRAFKAAVMTYVAATAAAILTLWYFLLRSEAFGRR